MPLDPELIKRARETLARTSATDETGGPTKTPAPPPASAAQQERQRLIERAKRSLSANEPSPVRTERQVSRLLRKRAFDSLLSTGEPFRPRPAPLPAEQEGTIVFNARGSRVVPDVTPTGNPLSPAFDPDRLKAKSPPKHTQLEEVLNEISDDRLDLPSDGISGPALAEARLIEDLKFSTQTDRISAAIPQDRRNVLIDLAAKINHQPWAPHERRGVLLRQRRAWAQAIAEGKAAAGLGANEARGKEIEAMDENLFMEVASKISANGIDDGQELLREDGPFGNERAAFRTLSPGFFKFSAQKRKYYTASERWRSLTGSSQDPPIHAEQAQLNLFDAVPDEPPFTVNHFASIFPELQAIQQQATQAAAAREQAAQAERVELSKLPVRTQILRKIDELGGVPGTASEAGQEILTYMDAATLHLMSAAIHVADTKLNTLVPYQQAKAWLVRDRLQGMPEGADAEEQWTRLLQDHPDLEPDRLREIAGSRIFTMRRLTDALPREVEQLTGLKVADYLGTTDESLKRAIGSWSGFFDNPFSALLSLGAIKGVRRKVEGAVALQRAAERRNALHALDNLPEMSDVAAELRAKMIDRTISKIRKGARNPADMRALFERLVSRVQNQGIGLTPRAIGSFRAAIERLGKLDEARPGRVGHRAMLRATEDLARDLRPPDFFQSAFILDEANRPALNPKAPSIVVEEAIKLLQESDGATQLMIDDLSKKVPGGRDNRQFRRLQRAIRARMLTNEIRHRSVARHARARDISKEVLAESDQIVNALEESLRDVTEQIGLEVTEHNRGLQTAARRAQRLEHDGGQVIEANPAIRSGRYKRASRIADSLEAAEAMLFSTRVQRTVDTAHAAQVLNKRGIASIGGPELVKRVQEIVKESVEETGKVSDSARREAALEVQALASEVKRGIEEPILKDIPPKSKPRTTALNKILKKFDDLPASQAVELTPAEVTLLNEYRPAKAALRPRFVPRNKALLNSHKLLSGELAREKSFRERVASLIEDLDQIEPGTVTSFKIPKRLGDSIARRLAEDETGLMYDKKTGLSLSEDKVLRGHVALWEDLRKELTEEQRLLRQKFFDQSSFELAQLPLPQQVDAAQTFLRENLRRRNEVLTDTARILEVLNRKISPEERILITESIRDGKVHPKLPKDAADYVIEQMFQLRKKMLDFDLAIGRLGPEQYAKFIGERYTHDQYIRDPRVRARVRASQLTDLSPTEQLAVAIADDRHFRFKRPEDSYWVEWGKEGQEQHQKGFRTMEDAKKWARTNLPEKTRWSANAPVPLLEKIAEGLDLDPGVNFGQLMSRWVEDQAKYLWQRGVSMLPDVLSGKAVRARGADAAMVRKGIARIDLSPERPQVDFVRINSPTMPHLQGKWIPAEAFNMAAEIFGGQQFMRAQVDAWNQVSRIWKKFQSSDIAKVGNNILSTSKVTLNPGAYIKGWFGNALYAHLADFSPLNPLHALEFIEYMAEVAGQGGLGKALRKLDLLEALATEKMVPEVREMLQADLIPVGETLFGRAFRKTQKIAEGPKAILSKIEDLESRILQLSKDDPLLPKASAQLVKLEQAFATASSEGLRDTIVNMAQVMGDALLGKKNAVGVTQLWNNYAVLSGDIPFKIATYMHLRRKRGMSAEKAAEHIRQSFQMFHDPQKWKLSPTKGAGGRANPLNLLRGERDVTATVKEVIPGSQSIGGALFLGYKTEQARILMNAAQYKTNKLLSAAGVIALWNATQMSGEGFWVQDYLEGYALEQGVQRNAVTDFASMINGIFTGRDDSGAKRMVSTDALFGAWFKEPFGGIGEALSQGLRRDSTDPTRALLSDLAGGVVGGLTASNALISLFGSALRGQTPRGTPVGKSTTVQGLVNILTETFAPSFVSGVDGERFVEILKGNNTEFNPLTYEPTDLRAQAIEKQIGMRQVQGPWRQVQQALHFHMTHRNQGHDAEWIRMEADRDSKHFKVANGAIDLLTGEIDAEKHLEVIREHVAGRGRMVAGPNRELIPLSDLEDLEKIKRELDSTRLPRTADRFNRQAFPVQVKVYATWREVNTHLTGPHAGVDRKLREMMLAKASSSYLNPIDIAEAVRTIDAFGDTLPDDAQRFLRFVGSRALARRKR